MSIPIDILTRLLTAAETIAGTSSNGSELIANTTIRNGSYTAIVMVTNTVFTTLTGNHEGWSGQTYPAGFVLNGIFSSIQLASGSVVAYRR